MLYVMCFSYKNKPAVLSVSLPAVDNIKFSAIINIEGSTTKWLAQKLCTKKISHNLFAEQPQIVQTAQSPLDVNN